MIYNNDEDPNVKMWDKQVKKDIKAKLKIRTMQSHKILAMLGHIIVGQQKALKNCDTEEKVVNLARSEAMAWDLYVEKVSVAEREELEQTLVDVYKDLLIGHYLKGGICTA